MSSFVFSGRLFVLGAGASAFAGYPVAADLLRFIRDLQSLDQATKDVASRVLEKFNQAEFHFARRIIRQPFGNPNLEQLLTYLELYASFPGTNFDSTPWTSSDSQSMRTAVSARFLRYQNDLQEAVWGDGKTLGTALSDRNRFRAVAQSWSRMLRPGDVVVSFNWDILHEAIFEHEGLWASADGYGFDIPAETKGGTKILLLKLHGSVNWIQENDSSPVIGLATTSSLSADTRSAVGGIRPPGPLSPRLVLPTYLKDVSSSRTLLNIWTQASNFISQASEVFVIGYSLNPVDHPARLLFGTALSENSGLDLVNVVSPDATKWAEFLPQVNKRFLHNPKKFEDWVIGQGTM